MSKLFIYEPDGLMSSPGSSRRLWQCQTASRYLPMVLNGCGGPASRHRQMILGGAGWHPDVFGRLWVPHALWVAPDGFLTLEASGRLLVGPVFDGSADKSLHSIPFCRVVDVLDCLHSLIMFLNCMCLKCTSKPVQSEIHRLHLY